jgi:biopolymer transport protein TolQ
MTDICPTTSQVFSFWTLFSEADWIIRGVILALIAASVVSWAIFFSKWVALRQLDQRARHVTNAFREGLLESGDTRFIGDCPFAQMAMLVSREARGLAGKTEYQHKMALERLDGLLGSMIENQRIQLFGFMTVLESIGSMAPFVGLFGTVWGVMNSFQGIAASKNPGIAAVAPGLAEALFTTAIGIGVAIPAVITGMRLRGHIENYCARMDIFASQLMAGCMAR